MHTVAKIAAAIIVLPTIAAIVAVSARDVLAGQRSNDPPRCVLFRDGGAHNRPAMWCAHDGGIARRKLSRDDLEAVRLFDRDAGGVAHAIASY